MLTSPGGGRTGGGHPWGGAHWAGHRGCISVPHRSLGVDAVLLRGGGDADGTHGVGCVRAASRSGAGGRSGSLARKTPIAAAVLLALSDGSRRCQLEGSGLCSQLPCSGARWLRRWKALSAGLPGGTRCPRRRAGHALGRADAALAFLGCVIWDARWELGAAPWPCASAGRAARPCCRWSSQHAVHIPSPPWSLLLSPSPGSGSSVQQPSRSAAWPCPWSSRRGTKDGGGAALRHGTCAGMCLSPAKGLPRGSADPFPRTRSC